MLPFEIEERLPDIRAEIERLGAELLDVQCRRWSGRSALTFTVDRAGGITLDDCVSINQALGRFFDALAEKGEDFALIRDSYYLEVNSPGLDRPIKTEADFSRAIGASVRVALRDDSGRVETQVGKILKAENEIIDFEFQGLVRRLPLTSIIKAVREVKFK